MISAASDFLKKLWFNADDLISICTLRCKCSMFFPLHFMSQKNLTPLCAQEEAGEERVCLPRGRGISSVSIFHHRERKKESSRNRLHNATSTINLAECGLVAVNFGRRVVCV